MRVTNVKSTVVPSQSDGMIFFECGEGIVMFHELTRCQLGSLNIRLRR